jgi:predicted alpha/beta superfamily hydrolase
VTVRQRSVLIVLACLLAAAVTAPASARAAQPVRVVVRVPADTPADASVYLAGSLPAIGGWRADGVRLARQADGTYAGDLALEPGQALEFKITRGSWQTVEKHADGSERPNRELTVDAATKQLDVTVERWASGDAAGAATARASTVVGTLKLHTIDSAALKQPRTIRVWLPPAYDAEPEAWYPVLYMHDGQNCFDRAISAFGNEWEIDEALTKLITDKTVPPMIVVGVDNGLANRINEYTYMADPKHGGGGAAAHARFLLEEVKPFVEKTYRARTGKPHTYVGGSSLGGLIALELARRHADVFGGVIAMSPAVWWGEQGLMTDVETDAGGLAGARVWIDMGTREAVNIGTGETAAAQNQRFVDSARRVAAALEKHHVEHRLVIDDGAQHNEPAWAKRFPAAIAYVVNGK